MKKINVLLLAFLLLSFWANAQQYPFNGLDMNMGNLLVCRMRRVVRSVRRILRGRKGKERWLIP